eukprot:jgi/Botrbrau1/7655/Bobra.0159s0097.1
MFSSVLLRLGAAFCQRSALEVIRVGVHVSWTVGYVEAAQLAGGLGVCDHCCCQMGTHHVHLQI